MSASRRTILLIASAVVLLAAFAVLPAPDLIFRRSPVVSDRVAGDVRRIAMTVEPDGSMHAALEVWTDSDWDIEYWSSITNLTPVARVVTLDLIEQREVSIAMTGERLALAWVDYDAKAKRYALQVTTKQRIDRNWAKPVAISQGSAPIRDVTVAINEAGDVGVAFVGEDGLRLGHLDAAAGTGGSVGTFVNGRRPAVVFADDSRAMIVAFESGTSVMTMPANPFGGEAQPAAEPRAVSSNGRAPAIAMRDGRLLLAWAETDAIRFREGDGESGAGRVAAPGLGDARPSIAFAGRMPVAAWASKGTVTFLDSDGTTQAATGCCPARASNVPGVWTAWLESEPGDAIERFVRLRYDGRPGRFTTGDRITVTALPADSGS